MSKATKSQLQRRIAQLESMNDHLMTELQYLDQLMRSIGFSRGIATVKATAQEILEQGYDTEENSPLEMGDNDNFMSA